MKDWFKARNIWGAAILSLSDDEAGKLAKAIWAYTMTGEKKDLDGAGKGIFAMILLTLGQDEERDAEISLKRSMATDSIRKQKISNNVSDNQMISNDIKSNQLISNDDNKNKNKSKNKNKEQDKEVSRRFTPPTLSEINQFTAEIGSPNFDAQAFIDYYESNGWMVGRNHMKDWKATIRRWIRTDGGKPQIKAVPKTVTAQNYQQRDYSNADEEALRRWAKMG